MTTWQELADLVNEAQNAGAYIPCRARSFAETAAWTSDVDSEQQSAADRCYDCPLFTTCRRAAIEISPSVVFGVMGGMTHKERTDTARARRKDT